MLIYKSTGKVMVIIFCNIQGIILNHFVPLKTTVTRTYYSTIIKSELISVLKRKRPNFRGLGYCCTMITRQAIATVLESVIVLCFVVRYFMSILVLQSSWWGRESWLLCLICLPGVS